MTEEVGSITAPTLCVVSDEDDATPPDLVEGLAKSIPDARLSIIKTQDIALHRVPAALAQLIQAHLREVETCLNRVGRVSVMHEEW